MNLSFFQKPSRYINREINVVHKVGAPVSVALAFPDVYEIGMSHLGLRILYKIINDIPFAAAERVFSPWTDLEEHMKSQGVMLSSLETNRPLKDFDIVGFSLQYELSYTTVLNMLSLGKIPLRTTDRLDSPGRRTPLIIAGGPCTVNPFPMAPFIDAFLIGDGEEAISDILHIFHEWKDNSGMKRESLLQALSLVEGIYVPVIHDAEGEKAVPRIRRRVLRSLDDAPYPDRPLVPYTPIIHDRVNIEVSRGCSMGCRFCQAGMIYRPVRERSPEKVLSLAESALKTTGYEEIAFTSLSAGDYSCLPVVLKECMRRFGKQKIAISLPSLRIASVNHEILKEIKSVRKTGFTIAPEAGTDRLRKVINKDFSAEEYEQALRILFEEGWQNLKLYFMVGLPTETDEDIAAIPAMVLKARKIARQYVKKFVHITVGISPFVPKAHTPFQWYGQNAPDELQRKKDFLRERLIRRGITVKGHDVAMSLLEAAFSRGDRNLSVLIEKAWSLGCRLDGWSETFDPGRWKQAMDAAGIDAAAYAHKVYGQHEGLPWDHIHTGVAKEFLWKEFEKALSADLTGDCRKNCHNCGLSCLEHNKAAGSIGEIRPEFPNFSSCHLPRFKPVRIRAEFSKTGVLRYLSHLELMTALHRAMRRAGIALEYSQGFHPAPKIAFGPPLGVGVAGLREYFDMEVLPPFDLEGNREALNRVLPEGMSIAAMSAVSGDRESLSSFISRYEYQVKGGDVSQLHAFLPRKELLVQREKYSINIRDMVEEALISEDNAVLLTLVDKGNVKVRLGEILPLIFSVPLERLDITRTALFGWQGGGWVTPLKTCKIPLVQCKM
ncbi:MAG: TIGR03960 family B12-binding radical SAM protein [Nitrospirota bacterium]